MSNFFIRNISNEELPVEDLNLVLPIGNSDLYKLNLSLTFDQIMQSFYSGKLKNLIEDKKCYFIQEQINNAGHKTSNVILRKPLIPQIHQSRVKTQSIINEKSTIFNNTDDNDLFKDEVIKSARELEEELRKNNQNIEKIEATIKEANLNQNEYKSKMDIKTQSNIIAPKIHSKKNYITCEGITQKGTTCQREAMPNSLYCGLHGYKKKKHLK